MKEFEKSKLRIRNILANARSKIYISFDLWTAPNLLALCGIVGHFCGDDLKNHSILLALKRVQGSHLGDNIAEIIIFVLKDYNLISQLGNFIADNHRANNSAIRTICQQLKSDINDPDSRRVRCVGHIINLIAKAFLFGNHEYAFETDNINNRDKLIHHKAMQKAWRKYGPLGRLHNIVVFIRASSERRKQFQGICANLKDVVDGTVICAF